MSITKTTTTTTTTTTSFFSKSLSVLSLMFILHTLLGPRVLYAMPHDAAGFERSIARQLASTENNKVRIEGELTCSSQNAQNSNDSESCALDIKERQTGKTYRLTGENESAQKLFKNGNKNVAVEGTLSNDTTVNVQSTQAL